MSLLLDARLGAQRPRVGNWPEYLTSDGEDAIDLAEMAGQPLDEWQRFVLAHGLGVGADGKWSAAEVACWVPRQNGKGGIIEARVMAGLFVFGERLILWSAHEYKTAQEGFLRVKGLIENTPSLHAKVSRYWQANGEQGIELHSGQRLRFVARSKKSGRGFSGDTIILDEAQELTELQMRALFPTQAARQNAQTWYFGTPPETGDEWCYSLRDDGESGEDDLAWFDWGVDLDPDAPDFADRLDDKTLWYASNPGLGIRITEKTVAKERRRLGDRGFAAERLGMWPKRQRAGSVIDPAVWASLGDVDSRRDGDVALAIDIAPLRDYASICVYGHRADGIGHLRLIDYAPGTDWLLPKLGERVAELDPIAVGMGRGTYESMKTELHAMGLRQPEDAERPARGDLAVASGQDMAAACGQMLDAVRQGAFRHVPAVQLDESVAGAKIRQLGESIAWARRNAETDTSPIASGTVARWAFEMRRPLLAGADYDIADSVY